MLAIAYAAGRPWVERPAGRDVVVMVDRSASTRTASYHDPALLRQRISQLLGSVPHQVVEFSHPSAAETEFDPPPADAIVLFSDGRFAASASSAPIYFVIDPQLAQADDARVERLGFDGDYVQATVANTGNARPLRWNDSDPVQIQPGEHVIRQRTAAETITSAFESADAWPENDRLSATKPDDSFTRWWIGGSPPSQEWVSHSLSTALPEYLQPAVIVLNNVPIDEISAVQQERLTQYVRDLGGGLVIVGGDRAFSAGGYAGSAIEALAPLSSTPPLPARHWILLLDSSGSMDSQTQGASRWRHATRTLMDLLPMLPPNDKLSVGSFARDLRWWSQSRGVSETLAALARTPDITPAGPTNLQPVLQTLVEQLDGSLVTEIVVIGDAEAQIDDPTGLASRLRTRRARLHLLATSETPNATVQELTRATDGVIAREPDPAQWSQAARRLLRGAGAGALMQGNATIAFSAELALSPMVTTQWNPAWLKRGATGQATATFGSDTFPLAATWRFGAGSVAAVAFPAPAGVIEAFADAVQSPARDPRFRIQHDASRTLTLRIDAIDAGRLMNDQSFSLAIGQQLPIAIPQTAPGRYELSMPAPRQSGIAVVRHNDRIIDRFAVPDRYAPEFEAIGIDRPAVGALAESTGGKVIPPEDTAPLDIDWPARRVSLVPHGALLGSLLIAMGLIAWKRA